MELRVKHIIICLFTCGLSRAVHLEVVQDPSVETFLQAFRRFAARKSLPRLLLSDNASTYVSAAKELQQLFTSHKLEESLSTKDVQWRFIPKRAPWYSGFWERLIGLTDCTQESTGEIIYYIRGITDISSRNRSSLERLSIDLFASRHE